jgi:hypothetical protein
MQKVKPLRSQKYLDWVKTQPSVISGRPADDAHHIKGHGYGGTTKPSDYFTFPLTRDEHTHFHNIGWQSWEAKYGSQWKYIAETLERAIREGVLRE